MRKFEILKFQNKSEPTGEGQTHYQFLQINNITAA